MWPRQANHIPSLQWHDFLYSLFVTANNSYYRSHDGRLAATGDDFGKVKLYAYPVTQPKVLILFLLKNSTYFF